MRRSNYPLVTVLLASLVLGALAWLLGRSLSPEFEAVELPPGPPSTRADTRARTGPEAVVAIAEPARHSGDPATPAPAVRAAADSGAAQGRLRLRLALPSELPRGERILVRYAPSRSGLPRGATIEPDRDGRFTLTVTPTGSAAPLARIGAELEALNEARGAEGAFDEHQLRHSLNEWARIGSDDSIAVEIGGAHLRVERQADGTWTLDDPNAELDGFGRVPVGADTGVWIEVEARFAYLLAPFRVDASKALASDREVMIPTRIGARLTGELEGGRAALQRALSEGPRLEIVDPRHRAGRPWSGRIAVDENGRFDHGPVPAGTDLVLTLASDAVRPFESIGIRLLAGETRHVTIPIRDGVLVAGTLLSETGAELAMHTIRVQVAPSDPAQQHASRSTRTDRHGRFELAGLPPGALTVELDSPHMMATPLDLGPLAEGESATGLELRARLAGRIEGTLFDVDGTIRVGTRIAAYEPDSAAPVAIAFTDDEGRFVLQGLTSTEYEVRATAVDPAFGPVEASRQGRVGRHALDLRLAASEQEPDR